MVYDCIATDPKLMAGVPSIRGMRVSVATVDGMVVDGMVADGMAIDEILRDFPYLEWDGITQVLQYAADAVRERKLPLRSTG